MLSTHAVALALALRRSNASNVCSLSVGHDVTSGRLENTAPIAIKRPVPSSVNPEITRMMRMRIAANESRAVGGPFMIGMLPVLDFYRGNRVCSIPGQIGARRALVASTAHRPCEAPDGGPIDRKSTRLNSSHL